MKIAFLGSRGIPANYGGFETCAEALALRLVAKGHQVSVYCCKPYSKNESLFYAGIKRIVLPTLQKKSLEKLVFTILSLIHVVFTKTDVILMFGISASLFCFIPRLFGIKVVINVDGLEWKREKWGRLASFYLRCSEHIACFSAHRLVTDARCVQDYYQDTYQQETTFIPYGVRERPDAFDGKTMQSLGVRPWEYVLYVSRFEPENNPLVVRRAFEQVNTVKQLLLVGSAPYATAYIQEVHHSQDRRILFPGAIYGNGYEELLCHAYVYIQATSVGGVHPALVEAIGFGNCIIANDVPEHREVLQDAGIYYDGSEADLAKQLQDVLDHPQKVADMRTRAGRLAKQYSWDAILEEYTKVFSRAMGTG